MGVARPASTTAHQRGAVIILILLLVGTFIVLVATVLNVGYISIVRNELQAAADAAAHAGAAHLCQTTDCYNDAKSAAIETLKQHAIHGRFHDSRVVDISAQDTAGNSLGPVWVDGNFRVTIERGRWWPEASYSALSAGGIETVSPGTPFEPYDRASGDWQSAHPGIPNYLVANAVRVVIERPTLSMLITPLLAPDFGLRAEAIAVSQRPESTCAAPFAVPLCALYSKEGKASNWACRHDFYFARSDRYCGQGIDCNVMPGFSWSPDFVGPFCPGYGSDPDWEENCWDFGGSYTCAFRTFPLHLFGLKYDESDYYGVVGIPSAIGGSLPANPETQIRTELAKTEPCFNARIGDAFNILSNGLSEATTGETMWQQIRDRVDPTADAKHPVFVDAFQPGKMGADIYTRVSDSHAGCNLFWMLRTMKGFAQEDWGLCNSRHIAYDDDCTAKQSGGLTTLPEEKEYVCQNNTWPFGGGQDDTLLYPCWDDTDFGRSAVWKMDVPVIVDYSASASSPCEGMLSSAADPLIDPDHLYVIVDFIKVSFYDLDIGKSAPATPDSPCVKDKGPPWNDSYTKGPPWGFTENAGFCNLVRGQLSCEEPLVQTTSDHIEPVLVR